MKVLVVTHDGNFSGGANRSLFANIKYLQETYDVEFLVLIPTSKGVLNKKLDEITVPWISLKYFGVVSGLRHDGKDILRRFKVFLGYYIERFQSKRLEKMIVNEGIDIVYTNTRLPMIGSNVADALKLPHVIHVREFGTVEPLWGKWNFEALNKHSNKIIVISNALKGQFLENHVPDGKLFVSHNGIKYDSTPFITNQLDKDEYHMILTARLVPDKGHKDAIYAVDKIVKGGLLSKKIVLHIVGSSPKRTHIEWYEKEIRELVRNLHLQEYIIFEGEVSNMPGIRSNMDVELMCAICETFGRVTVEAMRSGLFVIGTNTGATPEIVSDGKTGLLYKQGNAEDLANKIIFALSEVNRFNLIRANAYEYATKNLL